MGFPDICGIGRGSAFKKDAAKAGKEISSNDALQDHLLKRKVLRQKVWKTPQNNTPFSSRLWEGCCRDNTVEVRPSSKQRKNCDRNQPSNKNNSLVKETRVLIEDEDFDGNKMINNYVRMRKIGGGSYCKVVLYRNKNDEKLYAMKVFRKSRLSKIRINQLETAMTDVLREASIMKKLHHPNVVKLIEVIDDPNSDHLFMVLEYMEKGWIFKGSGPSGGIGERVARAYFKDMVAGLKYLHDNNIMHGDIKPENLLLSGDGHVKICDFSASRMFEVHRYLRRQNVVKVQCIMEKLLTYGHWESLFIAWCLDNSLFLEALYVKLLTRLLIAHWRCQMMWMKILQIYCTIFSVKIQRTGFPCQKLKSILG
eukprot:TRINITY_DN5099_c0_g1_i3.p1 TRINITY_DN5099_c0_g1~~TRINITY_DN5099_c0_g1_i3.p1  ORF type:complete len:367 (+),score=46.28 TRINITY_DN5099_c0_g1_i3:129-1229(+)